ENAQTLANMVRFYQMLASDGRARPPYLVHPAAGTTASLGLLPDQLAGLRQAMVSVVERGTARGAGRFGGSIAIAGKTGTAQNSHGPDHGWFIAFAPADKPEIVVGAIIEFARHGTSVAPLVSRAIAHYLGIDERTAATLQVTVPNDSAPAPFPMPVIPDSVRPDFTRPDSTRPDSTRPVIPDSAVTRPPTR